MERLRTLVRRRKWTLVNVSGSAQDADRYKEQILWCKNQFNEDKFVTRSDPRYQNRSAKFVFKESKDALMFALVWNGSVKT